MAMSVMSMVRFSSVSTVDHSFMDMVLTLTGFSRYTFLMVVRQESRVWYSTITHHMISEQNGVEKAMSGLWVYCSF